MALCAEVRAKVHYPFDYAEPLHTRHGRAKQQRTPRVFWSSPCPLMGRNVNMTHILPCMSIPRTTTCAPQTALHCVRRAYSHFPPARRRHLLQKCRASPARKGKRTFIAATRQRLADNDSSSSYRQQDRESDGVDVCIVGGGKSCLDTDLL